MVSDCQTSAGRAFTGLVLADFSADPSRDEDPEAGFVKQ